MATAPKEEDAIREVLAECCFLFDVGQFADTASLFAEGGIWETDFDRFIAA